jgi:hypothetical protein
MIPFTNSLHYKNSDSCIQIKRCFLSLRLLNNYRAQEARHNCDIAQPRSREADDHRFREKKCFARIEADSDVSVVEHLPDRMTVSDQLADALHHERFGRIRAGEPGDGGGRSLASASPSSTRPCIESTARKHCANHSLFSSIRAYPRASPTSARDHLNGLRHSATRLRARHSEYGFRTERPAAIARLGRSN